MGSTQKSFIITKQLKMDFQIILLARNEKEAAYHADQKEIELWNEMGASYEIIEVSRVSHLVLVDKSVEQKTIKPVIRIWEKT
jgi:hypothetical protein